MKLLIFGGFLGSGKTTALMQMAKYMVDHSASESENKVIILENEVGEVGIDDAYLRGGGFMVDNLFSGCACCTVSGELTSAAYKIKQEFDPEWIILETTGIAYPRKIQDNMFRAMGVESRIGVLVDASRWQRLRIPMHDLLYGQIEGADAVLINKVDLVTPEQADAVEEEIRGFDGNTQVFRISATEPVDDSVWKGVTGI